MPTIASSATSVLIAHVAAHTERIRVGAGRHHASQPLAADHRGTVRHPWRPPPRPHRPGTRPRARRRPRRLRRPAPLPRRLRPLPRRRGRSCATTLPAPRACRASSRCRTRRRPPTRSRCTSSAPRCLAPSWPPRSGLPYAFASHFAPAALHEAVRVYRDTFQPSDALAEPYVIAGVSVYAAEDPRRRRHPVRDVAQAQGARHDPARARPREYSDDEVDAFLASPGGAQIAQMARYTAVGTPADVAAYLENFAAEAQADELITVHGALDPDDRERSLRLAAGAVASRRTTHASTATLRTTTNRDTPAKTPCGSKQRRVAPEIGSERTGRVRSARAGFGAHGRFGAHGPGSERGSPTRPSPRAP